MHSDVHGQLCAHRLTEPWQERDNRADTTIIPSRREGAPEPMDEPAKLTIGDGETVVEIPASLLPEVERA